MVAMKDRRMPESEDLHLPRKTCVVNRHSKNLLGALNCLLEDHSLCDVSLIAGGQEFQVHRVVLAANSSYFARMFGGSMTESKSSAVELQEITSESLHQLINFSYTSSFDIDENNAVDLLIASNMLQFPDVTLGCCEFLEENLNSKNCLDVYCLAELHDLERLRSCSLNYIKKNFRKIAKSNEFLYSDIQLIQRLLHSDDLNIYSENDVFEALVRWTKHDAESRTQHLPTLLKLVRLPLMSPKVLVDVVEKHPLVEESDQCMRIVNKSKTYHLFPADKPDEDKWLLPRETLRNAQVFLIGGEVRHEVLDHVDKYLVEEDRWECMSPMSYPRDGLGVAISEGRIYIAGGYDGKQALNSCELYNIEKDAWSHISGMNLPRHACSLIEHQGWIYALGGSDYASKEHSSVERYDPIRGDWTDMAPLTTKREGLSTAALYGCIYALGGDNGITIVNTVERLDPRIGSWHRDTSMGFKRRYFGACVLNDKIYVAGGSDFEEEHNSLECFDIRANKWQPLPSMLKRREGLSVLTIGSRVVAFGGSCCNKETESAEVYDPVINNWQPFTAMSRPREGMGAIIFN